MLIAHSIFSTSLEATTYDPPPPLFRDSLSDMNCKKTWVFFNLIKLSSRPCLKCVRHMKNVFLYLFFRHLEALEKERAPQILAIHHGSEDEADEDEEGFADERSKSSDEDQSEETCCTGSLDSSFHSLSPGDFFTRLKL